MILFAMALACLSNRSNLSENFYQAGVLSQILSKGAAFAPVSNGLAIHLKIDKQGNIGPNEFDVSGTGLPTAVHLALEDLKYSEGNITFRAAIKNTSGSPIEGVRFDHSGVAETYRAKDKDGKDIQLVRSQSAKSTAPPYFGDLATAETADPIPMQVSGVSIKPETIAVDVKFVLSGLRFIKAFGSSKGQMAPKSIHVAKDGSLLISAGNTPNLFRFDAEGENQQTVYSVGEQPFIYHSVNPKTDEWTITPLNSNGVLAFSKTGTPQGKFPPGEEGFGNWAHATRYDREGNLWVEHSSSIHKYSGAKKLLTCDNAGAYFEGYAGFDVDADGRLWVACKEGLVRFAPDLKAKTVIATGHNPALGAVVLNEQARNVRIDSAGNAWLCEEFHIDPAVAPRISVFDRNGRFIRSFGRGGRTSPEADSSLAGGLGHMATDVAFGKNGRVYVTSDDLTKSVLVFEAF